MRLRRRGLLDFRLAHPLGVKMYSLRRVKNDVGDGGSGGSTTDRPAARGVDRSDIDLVAINEAFAAGPDLGTTSRTRLGGGSCWRRPRRKGSCSGDCEVGGRILRDQLRDYELEHACLYADVHGRHQARDLRFHQVAGGVPLLDTEEVTGSIPVSPTTERPGQRLRKENPARPSFMIGPVAGAFPEHSFSPERRQAPGRRLGPRGRTSSRSLSASRMRLLLSVRRV